MFGFSLIKDTQIAEIKAELGAIKTDISTNTGESVFNPSDTVFFDGEKTPYEMGTPVNFKNDYYAMRMRAWESYLMSDVIQNALRKYCLWIVGSGLKLQSNPNINVLKKYKVNIDKTILKQFVKDTESQFRLYASMKQSVYSQEYTLHDEAAESLLNALMAGDILCINRLVDNRVCIETIDGKNVITPLLSDINYIEQAESRGNIIKDGVEIDSKGSHVAYYIMQSDLTFKRVLAYGKNTGKRQAWLFYGLKYKKSDVRGMSLLAAVMETAASMDRYKSATLAAAEENANIPLTIEHKAFSDGSNPMATQIAGAFGKGKGTAPETNACDGYALKIAQTTKKTTYNMPVGAEIKRHAGSTDNNFKDYYSINIEIVYSTIGIPPEVAIDKFGGSYSGSRAALKSWEYKMFTDRETQMKRQFYKPFYDYWLDIEILDNLVQAPGYLKALQTNNFMVIEAYRNCRFIGATVPHIDPLKEVNAERKKLGKKFDDIPITAMDNVSENLNTGDWEKNLEKASEEYALASEFTKKEIVENNNLEK